MKVCVLGAGKVGSLIAKDLSEDFKVTSADINDNALRVLHDQHSISTQNINLSDSDQVRSFVQDYDLVVGAVPGFMGYEMVKSVIEAGKDIVDISFFPEDSLTLDGLAREQGVTAIVDCGVAPGMSNLLTGYVDYLFDRTERVRIYVGGLPQDKRAWPNDYKTVFCISDVIEEYIRPSRIVRDGEIVVLDALSEREKINFPEVGELEAFVTDGLRTLVRTIDAPDMIEKTLRYVGHVDNILRLRVGGYFDEDKKEETIAELSRAWKMQPEDKDFTIMRVEVEGMKGDQRLRHTYNLFYRFDTKTNTTSMARTTGLTATTAVRMLARGLYTREGISPPELIGQNLNCAYFMLEGLKEKGIIYNSKVEMLED